MIWKHGFQEVVHFENLYRVQIALITKQEDCKFGLDRLRKCKKRYVHVVDKKCQTKFRILRSRDFVTLHNEYICSHFFQNPPASAFILDIFRVIWLKAICLAVRGLAVRSLALILFRHIGAKTPRYFDTFMPQIDSTKYLVLKNIYCSIRIKCETFSIRWVVQCIVDWESAP